MAVNSLSNEINNKRYGFLLYNEAKKHLFDMDSLVEMFNNVIRMFSIDMLDICAKAPFVRSKLKQAYFIE